MLDVAMNDVVPDVLVLTLLLVNEITNVVVVGNKDVLKMVVEPDVPAVEFVLKVVPKDVALEEVLKVVVLVFIIVVVELEVVVVVVVIVVAVVKIELTAAVVSLVDEEIDPEPAVDDFVAVAKVVTKVVVPKLLVVEYNFEPVIVEVTPAIVVVDTEKNKRRERLQPNKKKPRQ